MADSGVADRWHKRRPGPDEPRCEHGLVASADHGRGKRWLARWRDLDGEQRKASFTRKADAEAQLATVRADLLRGTYIDPSAGRETFQAVGERWRTSAAHRPTTAARVRRALVLHVYPTQGKRSVASIRQSEVRAWLKDRSGELAPSTVRVVYSYVVSIFRAAVQDRIIAYNPCDGIRPPERRKVEIEPLPAPVVRALITSASERYRAVVHLGVASGLRQGELFGLEVEQIDFLRRTVRVTQQLVCPDDGKPYLSEPKTHESYRTAPVAKSAIDALSVHLARFPARAVLIEDRTDPRKPVMRTARLVFTTAAGAVVRRDAWAHVWSSNIERANVALAKSEQRGKRGKPAAPGVQVPAGASLHDLRHFYASALIAAKESVKTVQRRLGHATPAITLNTYTHLWPDAEDTTRAAIEAVLGDVPPMCPESIAE